ncbi:hypothetical protein Emed_000105 [Eimeria media]
MTLVDLLVGSRREAIKQTCRWFEEACIQYPEQARAAVKKLPKAARLEALKTLKIQSSSSSSSKSSSSSSNSSSSSSSSSSDEGSSSDETA